jgi:hypothetical protein
VTAVTRIAARELFDRWERVWHDDRHELVAECVAPVYVRHEETGTRHVTPAQYAEELAALKRARPNIRVTVFDHEIVDDRAWFRFAMTWDDVTGNKATLAGLQVYRIEGGKLAETWVTLMPPGSSWPDSAGQVRWTSPLPARVAIRDTSEHQMASEEPK